MKRRQNYHLSYLNVPLAEMGEKPDYDHALVRAVNLDTLNQPIPSDAANVKNCIAIQRLQSALWLRRQQNRLAVKGN